MTVYLDMENDPTIKIDLYRYDGTHCLAMVDRKPLALVKRSDVVDLESGARNRTKLKSSQKGKIKKAVLLIPM